MSNIENIFYMMLEDLDNLLLYEDLTAREEKELYEMLIDYFERMSEECK